MDATGNCGSLVKAFPLVKKKANHVVKVLHNYVFPVFGLPAIIHSDNGK